MASIDVDNLQPHAVPTSSSFTTHPRQQPQPEAAIVMSAPESPSSKRATTSAGLPASASASAYTQSTSSSASNPQASRHPPSKSATGGQSHSHRPVSAMPTPASGSSQHRQAAVDSTAGLANGGQGAYADRRASAHPTVPVSSQSVIGGLPQLAMSPSIDASLHSSAISSGIPITSPAALAYFAAHPRRQQVHFGSYLLLQTLGEGEFGKVKLGVHKEW